MTFAGVNVKTAIVGAVIGFVVWRLLEKLTSGKG